MFGLLKKDDVKSLNVNDIDDLIGKIDLVDIREPYEYLGGSLKGAKNIPMQKLISDPSKYMKENKTYYVICHSGSRSGRTCRYLTKLGYDVVNVTGGYGSYVGSKRK
jgi:rhodanese-related sulfurtransferase